MRPWVIALTGLLVAACGDLVSLDADAPSEVTTGISETGNPMLVATASMSKCRQGIRMMSIDREQEPVTVSDDRNRRVVRFDDPDGVVTVTCDREAGTMSIEEAPSP